MNRQQRRAAASEARKKAYVIDHRTTPRLQKAEFPPPRRFPVAGLVLLAIILFYTAIFLMLFIRPAIAHSWHDPACCSGQDCAPAQVGSVVATRNGWAVHIEPGEHQMLGGST